MTSRSSFTRGVLAFAFATLLVGPAFAQTPLPDLPSHVNVPFTRAVALYEEDFSNGDGGFTTGGDAEWALGTPTGAPALAEEDATPVWGTNLHGEYDDFTCGFLQSPPIDLTLTPPDAAPFVDHARLAFRHWFDIEHGFDGAVVWASPDGEHWRLLTPEGGYPETVQPGVHACLGVQPGMRAYSNPFLAEPTAPDAWQDALFDVSEYLGGTLHVRWVFASDFDIAGRGWYVDDVSVQAGATATVPVPGVPEVPFTTTETVYAEDFELDDGGWTATGTDAWAWGPVTGTPFAPTGSAHVWGTRLDGAYPANACSFITSPPIALPALDPAVGVETLRLGFDLWRDIESGIDGAVLQASTDGGATWERVTPRDGYDGGLSTFYAVDVRACLDLALYDPVWTGPDVEPGAHDWSRVNVDLSRFAGEEVLLRFGFASDVDYEYRGAYVDNVHVLAGVGGTPDPFKVNVPAPGWKVTGENPSWSWGVPVAGALSPTPAWSTNLLGAYNRDECGAIVSPPLDTSTVHGFGSLKLRFDHWYRTAHSDDGGVVQVSRDDGATWTTVTPIGGYDASLNVNARACLPDAPAQQRGFTGTIPGKAFTTREVRLDAFADETIRVRFVFASGPAFEDAGWTVRNVQVTRGLAHVPVTPTSSGSSPFLEKADPALVDAVANATEGTLPVIVTGPAHEDLAASDYATRADALRALDARAAPFTRAVRALADAAGARVVNAWSAAPAVKVDAPVGLLHALAAREDVRALTLDREDALRLVDPVTVRSSGDVGAANTEGRHMIQAEEMWALGFRGEGVRVSIIDSGIDASHEAFRHANGSSRIVGWLDAVAGHPEPYDDNGHGTHAGATAVGSSAFEHPEFGAFRETGVAPAAEVLAAKFLSRDGSGSYEGAMDALTWSFEQGADVASNSWGGACDAAGAPVMATVRSLTDLGMLSVFAAGNSGPFPASISGPACSESALSVGAVDADEEVAWFSSRGPCRDVETDGAWRYCPDVMAKGVDVTSAVPRENARRGDPSGYLTMSGTSMAAPHVAGAVALAEQMKRAYTGTGWDTANRAEHHLFRLTAKDLGEEGPDVDTGFGLVQLAAIHALLAEEAEAHVLHTFGVSQPLVRQGDETLLSFSVRNLGTTPVTGAFRATVTAPDGSVTVLRDRDVTLHLLDGESVTHAFRVGPDVAPGTYAFNASFTYAWTHPDTGEVVRESITRGATFLVQRVQLELALDGVPANASVGDVLDVTGTAVNAGNEVARDVLVELAVPDGYRFVPTGPGALHASPEPDRVHADAQMQRSTLVWRVDALAPGDAFAFTARLVPTMEGTHHVALVGKYVDGAGNGFSESVHVTEAVRAPVPVAT